MQARELGLMLAAGALCAAGAAGATGTAAAQGTDSLPPGVTATMVKEGASVFRGPGMCIVCHGPDGKGAVGPNLTDAIWLHSKGTYDDIVKQVTSGVPVKESTNGIPMPPKGGSAITEAQVKAVAAYVWTLSRTPAK